MAALDQFLAEMLALGFSLEDSHRAAEAGYQQPQAAINWLLETREMRAASSTNRSNTLSLRPGSVNAPVSNPFVDPHRLTLDPVPDQPPQQTEIPAAVVSRLAGSEEVRRQKESLREKERLAAKREALLDKQSKKQIQEQVRKEIAADRERKKMLSGTPKDVCKASDAAQKPTSRKSENKAMLRIRDPRGTQHQLSCEPASSLLDVLRPLQEQLRESGIDVNLERDVLVQPFPRREFRAADMTNSLISLQLTPSASLMWTVQQTSSQTSFQPAPEASQPAQVPAEADDTTSGSQSRSTLTAAAAAVDRLVRVNHHNWGAGHSLTEDTPREAEVNSMQAAPPAAPDVPAPGPAAGPAAGPSDAHQWGAGRALDADEEMADAEVEQAGGEGGDEEAMEEDDHPPDMFGLAGGHLGFMNDPGQQEAAWGQGFVLNEDITAHHSRPAAQWAAERNREHYRNVQSLAAKPSTSNVTSAVVMQTRPLFIQCLNHVAARLTAQLLPPITNLPGLPSDILNHLIAYLIREELLNPKSLRALPSVGLITLDLTGYPLVTNELIHGISLHPYLTELRISAGSLFTDTTLPELARLRRLRRLSLMNVEQLNDRILAQYSALIALEELTVSGSSITDEGLRQFCTAESRPALRTLDVSRTRITSSVLPAIVTGFPLLESLELAGTEMSDIRPLQGLSRLRWLGLSRTRPNAHHLRLVLNQLHELRGLDLTATETGDSLLHATAHSAARLSTLRLPERHHVTDDGVSALQLLPLVSLDLTNYLHVGDASASAIASITSLQKLLLSNTSFTGVGIQHFSSLSNLRVLDLSKCVVKDETLSVLLGLKLLQELSLERTNITNTGLYYLNVCPRLQRLNLARTRISYVGLETLQLPQLQQLCVNGTYVLLPERIGTCSQLPGCPNLVTVLARDTLHPRYMPEPGTDE